MGFRVERDVMVPMRDGVRLATDLWIPNVDEEVPALLVRGPYGKDVALGGHHGPPIPNMFPFLDSGYAVIWQDSRGAFGSEGRWTPLVDEPHDGTDTIAWLRDQPWCDGSIATYGASYYGFTQWAAASLAPEGLKAIAPTSTTTDYYSAPWYSDGGAFSYHTVWWWAHVMAFTDTQRALAAGDGDVAMLARVAQSLAGDEQRALEATPADQTLLTEYWPWYSDWVAHDGRDEYWQSLSVADKAAAVTAPALSICGWFDFFVNNATRTFAHMKAAAGSAEAREGQRLIIGPWDHLHQMGVYPDRQFGLAADAAACDLTGAHLRFFDRWVRNRTEALDGDAPVRIFVMGIDQWRDEQGWPLPDTTYVDYFLDSDGRANTHAGDGTLSPIAPTAEAIDTYNYDPMMPVPSLGGRTNGPAAANRAGPADQRAVETRADVLCYSSAVLEEPVEVTGHISLELYVASTAVDTDFTGKLVDVHPDGKVLYLTDGILRARYRDTRTNPSPLESGRVYAITIDLAVTSNVFLPGHRIRLEVSSSNFPRYDRNLNTGKPAREQTLSDAVVAKNSVLHGPDHLGKLTLPLIRR